MAGMDYSGLVFHQGKPICENVMGTILGEAACELRLDRCGHFGVYRKGKQHSIFNSDFYALHSSNEEFRNCITFMPLVPELGGRVKIEVYESYIEKSTRRCIFGRVEYPNKQKWHGFNGYQIGHGYLKDKTNNSVLSMLKQLWPKEIKVRTIVEK